MTDFSRSLDSSDGARAHLLGKSNSPLHDFGHCSDEKGRTEGEFESAGDTGEFAARLETAKLEALAEFAAGAGHEINNPLATISGRVQMLLREETDPERRQALLTIGGQALRIRDMIGDLMLFGRPPQPHLELLRLSDAVREALEPLRETAAAGDCAILFPEADPVEVLADPVQLKVVVGCLVRNAVEALRNGGEVILSVSAATFQGCPAGLLTVTDDGPGLSETERVHLFDPFFSGRQAGRGLGFGLPKCWRIVAQHRGQIEVNSSPGAGTAFRVYWPGAPSEG